RGWSRRSPASTARSTVSSAPPSPSGCGPGARDRMRFQMITAGLLSLALLTTAATGQARAPTSDWRVIAPENLLVIDTAKGRVLVELAPLVAPLSVERIRTLADQGFYDGLTFHRVLAGFMAQTGDPEGTGAGGSA